VAVMALVAAASLPPGEYFAINTRQTVESISALGFPVTGEQMAELAARVGEKTVMGRTGGAPCLAVGMAEIFQRFLGGETFAGLWYHFAIMFEALFILTTLDAGTRVGRYLLQDSLRRLVPRLAGTDWGANVVTSTLFVAAWGYFLVAGVLDSHGGVRALWPLFGIANQILAATALAIVTTILVRTGRGRYAWVTGLPLAWLLIVTMTAGVQKIAHPDPRIGFLAEAAARASGALATDPATRAIQVFNARLDAVMAGLFLILVATVMVSAAREWWLVARGRREIEHDGSPPGGGADPLAVVGPMRCC
jgi:carbon starvation protein